MEEDLVNNEARVQEMKMNSEKHKEFNIAGIPPSVNHCYGLRCVCKRDIKYPTKEMKQYKEFVKKHLPEMPKPFEGPVALIAVFFFNDNRRRDIDNCMKVLQDSMNGVMWKDDSQIIILHAEKQNSTQGYPFVHVIIEEL